MKLHALLLPLGAVLGAAVPPLVVRWRQYRQAWVSPAERAEWQDWWRHRDHPTGWEHFTDDESSDTA